MVAGDDGEGRLFLHSVHVRSRPSVAYRGRPEILVGVGGTIHRCIDISRCFSRDTYRDIIFYNHNFFSIFCLFVQDFNLGRKDS